MDMKILPLKTLHWSIICHMTLSYRMQLINLTTISNPVRFMKSGTKTPQAFMRIYIYISKSKKVTKQMFLIKTKWS